MATKRTELQSTSARHTPLEVFGGTDGLTLRSGLEIWRLTWAQLDELRPKSAPKKSRPAVVKRATQIGATFPLTEPRLTWAAANLPRGFDVRFETACFVDYYRSTGRTRANWEASWRNWMRRAVAKTAESEKPQVARRTRSVNEQLGASLRALELAGEADEAEEIRRRIDGRQGERAGVDRAHA